MPPAATARKRIRWNIPILMPQNTNFLDWSHTMVSKGSRHTCQYHNWAIPLWITVKCRQIEDNRCNISLHKIVCIQTEPLPQRSSKLDSIPQGNKNETMHRILFMQARKERIQIQRMDEHIQCPQITSKTIDLHLKEQLLRTLAVALWVWLTQIITQGYMSFRKKIGNMYTQKETQKSILIRQTFDTVNINYEFMLHTQKQYLSAAFTFSSVPQKSKNYIHPHTVLGDLKFKINQNDVIHSISHCNLWTLLNAYSVGWGN